MVRLFTPSGFMFDRLIHFSIHNKLIIGLLTLALVAWGGYSLTHLPIDAVPDITTNQVVVYTVAPSLAAGDIERLVSFPIEQSVATIPGRQEVRSFSRFGLSVVTIVFEDKTDIYWARQQVSERLLEAESQIPAGIGRPELSPVSTGLGEVYQYLVRAEPGYEKQYDARELRTIQDWIVRRQLLGTPGVADVSSFGGLLKQYEVALDPQRLQATGVTVDQVYQAVSQGNQNAGGAYIDRTPEAYYIRTEGLAQTPADIGNIVVRTTQNGLPVLVRDVATVQLGSAVRYGAMTRNQEGEVTGGIVLMLKGANANDVIKAVKQRMATIRQTLPKGVTVDVYLDRSELVGRAIHTVQKNLLEGALIVVFVLVLFLGNWRAGLVVASVIPLAMLFAISLMRLFGVSGNLMSLGAIDFGLIVDGAVIIVEAIVHRLHGGGAGLTGRLSGEQMDEETYQAASKIRSSAAFGEIIILIVYLPLLALAGIEGRMFRPMAQTVAFAILGAFILSLTYVPMMSALALSRNADPKVTISDRMLGWLTRRYDPLVTGALRHKTLVLGTAVALLGGAFLLFRTLGGEFIPQLAEGDFAVELRTLPGSSLEYTIEKSQQAAGILKRQFPDEVKEVVAKVGAAEIPTDPMPVEAADVMVILRPQADWKKADNQADLAEQMAAAVGVIPGVTFGFQQPIQMRFNELISGAKQDVVLKIFGEDLTQLADYARQAGAVVRRVPGAEDVYVEQVTGLPQIVVRLDRARLARFGLSVGEVNRTVQTAFAGQTAGQVFEQERRYDLVLRLRGDLRRDINSVRQLFIATPTGQQVPLEQVATVVLEEGPNQIQRDDTKRRVSVGFNVRGRDVETVVREVQQRLAQQVRFAPGYYTTYGGQFENLREATDRLSIAVPVALGLIFVLLFFTFNSVKQALLIFTAIPLSAIGGVLALWLRGMPFSIPAGVGFIALFGVAVLNGIVLIGYFNQLKAEGVTDLYERIRKGTEVRLRPVLMTATVASLGFLPMALATSAGAEVQRPLATVVIGGLVTATLLTLLVLPVLYALSEKGAAQPTTPPKAAPRPALAQAVSLLLAIGVAALLPGHALGQDVQLPPAGSPLNSAQAVSQALGAGGTVQAAQRAVQAQQALRRGAVDFSKTTLNGSVGQYNTYRADNQFSIVQPLALPGVYRSAARVAGQVLTGRELQLTQARVELRRQVRLAYEQAVYARHRLRTLRGQDSLYAEFLRAANLRFKTGEVARLEPATALVQRGETRVLVRQARTDYAVARRQLQSLLQQAGPIAVADSVLRPLVPAVAVALGDTVTEAPLALADTVLLQANPQARVLAQQIQERRAETRLEQARGLPDFTVGYFNQSLRGPQTIGDVGGPERYYGAGDRFQGVQASVGMPLYRRPQKARVQAARLQEQTAEIGYARYRAELAGRLDELLAQRHEQIERLRFYEQTGLPQAAVIVRLSTRAFKAGETGYAEYLLNLERALRLRTDYLAALLAHNQTVIELDALLAGDAQ